MLTIISQILFNKAVPLIINVFYILFSQKIYTNPFNLLIILALAILAINLLLYSQQYKLCNFLGYTLAFAKLMLIICYYYAYIQLLTTKDYLHILAFATLTLSPGELIPQLQLPLYKRHTLLNAPLTYPIFFQDNPPSYNNTTQPFISAYIKSIIRNTLYYISPSFNIPIAIIFHIQLTLKKSYNIYNPIYLYQVQDKIYIKDFIISLNNIYYIAN